MDGSYTSRMAMERKDAIEHKHSAHASHKLTPPYSTPLTLPFNGENLWREDSASISVGNEPIYTHPHHRQRMMASQPAATVYPPPPAFPHATPTNEHTMPAAANNSNNSVAHIYPLQPPPPLPTSQLKINYPLPPTAAPLHPASLSASPMQVNPNSKSTLHIPFGLPVANTASTAHHHHQYQQHSQISRDGLPPSRVNSSPALSQLPLTSNLSSNNPSLPHALQSNPSLAAVPLTRNLTTPPLGSASASPAHTTPKTNVSIPPRPSSSSSISSAVTSPPARSYPQSFTPYPSPQTPNSASSQSSTASASAAASVLRSIQSSPVPTRTLGHQPALSAPLRPQHQQLEANISHNVRLPFSNPSSPTGMLQPVLPSHRQFHHPASHHSFTFSNSNQLYSSTGSKLQQARKKFLPTCSCACVCRGTHEVAGYPELNCSCLTQALPLYSSSHVSAVSGTSTSLTLNISSPLQNSEIQKATKCLESGHIFLLHTLVDPTGSSKKSGASSNSSSLSNPHAAAVSTGGALTHVKKIVVFLFQDALYCCNYSAGITKYSHPFLKIPLCTEGSTKNDPSRKHHPAHPKSWNVDPNPQMPQPTPVFSMDSYANHHPVRFYPYKQGSALRLNKSCPSRRCATLVFPNPEYDAEYAKLKSIHESDNRQSAHMSGCSRSVSTRVSPSNQGQSFQVRLEPFAQAQLQMQQQQQQAELIFPPFTQGASHIFATPVPLSQSVQNSPETSQNHSSKREISSPRSPLSPISPIPTSSHLGHSSVSASATPAPLMPTHTVELEASSSAHMHSFIHALHIYLQANSKGGLLVLSGVSHHSETHLSHTTSRLYASSLSNRRARAREERRKQRLAASRMTQAAVSLSAQETRMKARGLFDAETGSILTKAKSASAPQALSEEDRKAEQRAGMRLLGALYDAGRGVREGKRRGEISRRMKEERELETSLREKGFQEYNGNIVRLPENLQIKSETIMNTRRAAEGGVPPAAVALPIAPNEPSLHARQLSEMSISSILSDELAGNTPMTQMNFSLSSNSANTPSDCSTLLSPDQPTINSEGRDVNFPRDSQAAKLPLHQQHHAANKSPQSMLTLAKTKSFFSAFLKGTAAKPADQMGSPENVVAKPSSSQHPSSYHPGQAQVQPHHQAVLPNVHPQSHQHHPHPPQIQSATLHSRGLSSPDLEFGLGLSASHANHAWVNSSHSTTTTSNVLANGISSSSEKLKLHTNESSQDGIDHRQYGLDGGIASAVPAHLHGAHFQPHPSPPARNGLNQMPLTQQCH